ncbi:MAG: DUF3263 domain-containing protein [Acidobacteria bacterium]|nr:DUF3263 domain-containing protein [Acidobacteriota bacterium]
MLSDCERRVLDFEGCWWQATGPKQRAIRVGLDMSMVRYSQILRNVIDDPEALVYAPLVTRRLRRRRDRTRPGALRRDWR